MTYEELTREVKHLLTLLEEGEHRLASWHVCAEQSWEKIAKGFYCQEKPETKAKMNIEFRRFYAVTIDEFSQKHDLTMEIVERSLDNIYPYLARFKGGEIKEGAILSGAYGVGSTPEDAIKDYASVISNKQLVFNAYGENRKVIFVPYLV